MTEYEAEAISIRRTCVICVALVLFTILCVMGIDETHTYMMGREGQCLHPTLGTANTYWSKCQ